MPLDTGRFVLKYYVPGQRRLFGASYDKSAARIKSSICINMTYRLQLRLNLDMALKVYNVPRIQTVFDILELVELMQREEDIVPDIIPLRIALAAQLLRRRILYLHSLTTMYPYQVDSIVGTREERLTIFVPGTAFSDPGA